MSKKKYSQKPSHYKIHNSALIQDISEHRSMEDKEIQHQHILPLEIEHELELNLQKYSNDINQEIRYILLDLLKYPSTELAQRHRQSNRLGSYDLKDIKNRHNHFSQYSHSNRRPQICEDCGLIVQQANIPICSTMWQFSKAGPGIFHFLQDIKQLAWQILILGIFYGIFALYTSIVEPTQSFKFSNIPRKVSYIPKMIYSSSNTILTALLAIEGWLMVFSVIIWWVMHLIMRCCQQKYQRLVDQEYLSPSHFTIMLQDVPAYYTKQNLQQEFSRYFQSLGIRQKHLKKWGYQLKPCQIERICKVLPFGLSENEVMDQQLKGLDKDISQKRRLLARWMLQFKQNSRFTFQKADRRRQYDIIEKMLQRRKNKLKQMQDKAKQQYKLPTNKHLKTIYFVTFKYNQTASIIEEANPQSIAAQIRYFITCCRTAHYITIRDQISNQDTTITARRAPDPQDIIWGNLNAPIRFRIIGKLASWGAIMFYWGATFGTCYGFNYLSIQYGLKFMPIVLAVSVTLFNMLIKFTIQKISIYQNDQTYTDRQVGILIKSIIGLGVNWIMTPTILSLAINANYYDSNGLVYFIFFLSISNAIIPPFLRIFDLVYLVKRILAYWQIQPYKKMELKQSQLNAYVEYDQYDIGWSYAYFIDLFFFTCFYAPMIPAIIIFTLVGFFFMFWAEKYVLLNRSRRPPVSCRSLTEAAKSLMLLGPAIIGFGGLIWVYILLPLFQSQTSTSSSTSFNLIILAAYLTLIGIGVLYFISPFESIYKCLCTQSQEQILSYEECRLKFPSQYQRMNPATFQQGTIDYYSFIQKKRDQDKITALNISQGNLVENFDINYIIDGVTKIPNIFGKNTEIANKINQDDYIDTSKSKKKKQDVIFVSAAKVNHIQLSIDQAELEVEKQDKLSRAQTQKKPPIVKYNSSGGTYSRRKNHNQRKTVSVLQQGYDVALQTYSHKH